jgi:large subunit ribosomal protein L2
VAPEVGNTLPAERDPSWVPWCTTSSCSPVKGGAIARSAGTFAQLSAREGRYATLKMPSGELRMILVRLPGDGGYRGQ